MKGYIEEVIGNILVIALSSNGHYLGDDSNANSIATELHKRNFDVEQQIIIE